MQINSSKLNTPFLIMKCDSTRKCCTDTYEDDEQKMWRSWCRESFQFDNAAVLSVKWRIQTKKLCENMLGKQ